MKWLNTLGRQRMRAFAPETDERLEMALESSTQTAGRMIPRVSKERAAAAARLSELLTLPYYVRDSVVASQAGFQTYSLALLSLKRSEKTVLYNPGEAIELARLAGSVVVRLDSRTCGGTAVLADLEVYALAVEGNAWRVSGDLQKALRTFTSARQAQRRGGVDADLMARVDRLEASLRRDLRQLDTSLSLLDRSARLFKSVKADNQLACTIINQSNVFHVKGEFEKAEALLELARKLACEPYLILCLNHNLIDIFARSGRAREAAQLLKKTNHLYLDFPDPLTVNRKLWVEGVIARELGENLEQADELLTEVTSRLANLGYAQDATLARFDLELLRAKQEADEALRGA